MTQVICLIGPDGTGKTTQAKLLFERLQQEGVKCTYKWMRFNHLFSLPILAIAKIAGLSETVETKNGLKVGYHYFYKSKIISILYKVTMYLDTLIAYLIKVQIPKTIFKKTVICDRFIYDTIVDIIISTRDYNFLKSRLGRRFLSLIPKDSAVILLITNEEILRKRREDIALDKYLRDRISLYLTLKEKFDIFSIDAKEDIAKIHDIIYKLSIDKLKETGGR
ncbi:MAG: hypothetical protein J7K33_01330 [Candidatus Marinimicrobia bacterium]|nr:hypothetical protein [Candidatus Neomarinimicrobiota bacterium]